MGEREADKSEVGKWGQYCICVCVTTRVCVCEWVGVGRWTFCVDCNFPSGFGLKSWKMRVENAGKCKYFQHKIKRSSSFSSLVFCCVRKFIVRSVMTEEAQKSKAEMNRRKSFLLEPCSLVSTLVVTILWNSFDAEEKRLGKSRLNLIKFPFCSCWEMEKSESRAIGKWKVFFFFE